MEVKELTYEDLVKIKEERKLTKEENKRYWKLWRKEYYNKNKDLILKKQANWYKINKEMVISRVSTRNKKYRSDTLAILGNSKCQICNVTDTEKLTIDHINGGGRRIRKSGFTVNKLYKEISQGNLSEEKIKNLRVLCWNHNCGQSRLYLDLPPDKQSPTQKYQTKLWKKALAFFGPCHCGESDLKFLTISHINNNGAELRKEGEQHGWLLLSKFNKSKWPESLKEDYRIECFNHNCSRGNKDSTSISPLDSS
jgi:hypothetical protein